MRAILLWAFMSAVPEASATPTAGTVSAGQVYQRQTGGDKKMLLCSRRPSLSAAVWARRA